MMPRKEDPEVRSMCQEGFDTYLSAQHRNHMKEGMEAGLLGAFIGTILTIGVSYLDSSQVIKMSHAWIPASIGFTGAVVAAYTSIANEDDVHKQDFEKVCDSIQSEDE
tara:strand:- start:288 stop:611 length:324 start_codon:yes stop_codon:yes gene_type:complete